MLQFSSKWDRWLVGGLALLLFVPFLGQVHLFDWDEINFAECAREMIATGDYLRVQIDFLPFYEKPPLFIWLQVLSMQVFGINEFAARFPNAMAGLASLLLLYQIGRQLFDRHFAWIWVLAYTCSLLPHLYFKSGIIDPWFNFFIFAGFYAFLWAVWHRKQADIGRKSAHGWVWLGGALVGLGILTKGPVALLLPGLAMIVYWVQERFRWYVPWYYFLYFILASLAITGTWFGMEILKNGPDFIREFLVYQVRLLSTEDAGHGGFPGYHVVVLLVGCFPVSIFALRAFWKKGAVNEQQADAIRWMRILFWVVLIVFSVVQSKIIHYSSLAYFPLSFLGALVVYQLLNEKIYPLWMRSLLGFFGVLLVALPLALTYFGQRAEQLKDLFPKDPFAQANLEASVHWTGWEILPGAALFVLLVLHFWLSRNGLSRPAGWLLWLGGVLYIQLSLIFLVGRIEGYSQRAAIEFCKSLQGQECYIQTIGYKSYAPHFYSRKQPSGHPERHQIGWLLNGDIDRDVYLITKIHKAAGLRKDPQLVEIGEKNGFVFFRRAEE